MIEYDFEQSIGYLVCSTSQAFQNALNEELRVQGITFRQWQVLACLALLGESASQAEIADLLRIERATLVGVLDRMERDGWIARRPCPDDRRKKRVRPTRQVKSVWRTMVGCAHRVRNRAIEGIDEEEYRIAWRVIERMRENLQTKNAHAVEETHALRK